MVAGSVGDDARDLADELAGTDQEQTSDGPGGVARLLAVPFDTPSGESGVLVVGQDTTPYERSERYALYATGILAVLVIATTALFALRVTRQALEPVARMAQRAAEWSERDLTSRFALGPPTNELAALGETLDHLLDRVASAILSEQRLTAELAHELRTPLTSIQGSADLALLRGVPDPATRQDLEQISASAHEMSAVITTLLDLARDESPSSRRRTCTVADLVPALVAGRGRLRAGRGPHRTFVRQHRGAEGPGGAGDPPVDRQRRAPCSRRDRAHRRGPAGRRRAHRGRRRPRRGRGAP